MSGQVDIQVGIGADARPLEREVAKARGSVHGFARDVEQSAKKMDLLGASAGKLRGVRPPAIPVQPEIRSVGRQPSPATPPVPTPSPSPRTTAAPRVVTAPAPRPVVMPPVPVPPAPAPRPVVVPPVPAPPAPTPRPVVVPPVPAPPAPAPRPVVMPPVPVPPAPVLRPVVAPPMREAVVPTPRQELVRTPPPQIGGKEPVYLPPVTRYDPRDRAARHYMPGLPEYRSDEKPKYGPLKTAFPPPVPVIPKEVMTGARRNIDDMAAASGRLGSSAGKAAKAMETAAKDARGPVIPAGRGAGAPALPFPRAGGEGIGKKLIRMPEFNVMGRMEGLLGGLTLGGLMMWIRGAEQAAAKTKELARAARLPTEEFIRLQQAAEDNQIPVETLNDAIKDYADGKITLQQVGEAVGIIGMRAGESSQQVKDLAGKIDDLAELNKQMEIVQEGASNLGKSITVGISNFFAQVSRMAIESATQGRAVSWWEAGEMMQSERARDKRQENAKMERDLRERRAKIKVEADLSEFFDGLDRAAAEAEKKQIKLKAITEARDERISRITVQVPQAGDSLARIGGFMGGRMDNKQLMIAERQLKVMEENARWAKESAELLKG